jgi:hypothetical protein
MTTTVTGSGPATRDPARARRPAARRGFAFPQASTTPGKVRLLRMGLVIACLGWSTGYLYGRIQPFPGRQRYEHDIAAATADLKAVTAASHDSAVSASLTTLSAELPVYTGYVEDGEIYNSLGYPAGASFIQVASEEMHLRLLPAARAVYAQENARLTAASAQATGLPLAVVTLAAGLALGFFLYRSQRWLSRRTHRTLNVGLLLASAAGAVALIWMAVALLGGRADLLRATGHGCAWGLSWRLAEYR